MAKHKKALVMILSFGSIAGALIGYFWMDRCVIGSDAVLIIVFNPKTDQQTRDRVASQVGGFIEEASVGSGTNKRLFKDQIPPSDKYYRMIVPCYMNNGIDSIKDKIRRNSSVLFVTNMFPV